MNERIRELAEQAGLELSTVLKDSVTPVKSITIEQRKFAELIVRECAQIADLADENKCEWIGGNILTHFGVEE